MSKILSLLFALTLFATSAFAQQTPVNTSCNDKSGLSWTLNAESDMGHYNVYASNSPIDETVDNTNLILLTIPHPGNPSATEIRHELKSNLSDGPKYFRVTAVDTPALNESPMSLEVGCLYDKIPNAPSNVQIIIKLSPPVSPVP